MASILEIQEMLQNFSLDRPSLLKNNSPEQIIRLLQNEVVEAADSLTDTNNLAGEISDIVIFALTLANEYGFDMDDEVRTKIAFNNARYSAIDFQEDYEQARIKGKAREVWVKPMFYESQEPPLPDDRDNS